MSQEKNQQPQKTNFPQMEEDVLKFWQDNKTFEKSVDKDAPNGDYVFYDGPPFATGLPHYGHIVASTLKDIIPRYKTMQGYRVERKWGWDCHGLPVENLIEKEQCLKSKKDIEEMGVDKFNEACRTSVMRYADEWKKFIPRVGRWVDMENDYKTMNPDYMESIWWVFKSLWEKDLIYEGYKSMHLCPRCETTLSNFEVTQGYKDIKDLSVTAKFELNLKDIVQNYDKNYYKIEIIDSKHELFKNNEIYYFSKEYFDDNFRYCNDAEPEFFVLLKNYNNTKVKKVDLEGDTVTILKQFEKYNIHILAWTTTPWTLPGNVALAVGEDINYVLVRRIAEAEFSESGGTEYRPEKEELFFVSEDFLKKSGTKHNITSDLGILNLGIEGFKIKGKDLIGLEYEPLFDYFTKMKKNDISKSKIKLPPLPLPNRENGWKIYPANFVTTEDGTGVVHIAPAFGDDDMNLGKENNLPFIQHVKTNGQFVDEVIDFPGMEVKPKDDHSKTDIEIIKWLAHNDKLFAKEKYEHSYPHCWRCDTPLLNYATSSWFVEVTKIKDKLLKNNAQTNWVPDHIRDGRFGKWLENARDWAISRSRYWGAPLPVWRCLKKLKLNTTDFANKPFIHEGCGHIKVIGSIEELETLSGQKVEDLHKEFVDDIKFKCEKCDGEMTRIPEVLDCWFESGSMPYAQKHYMGKPLDDFDPESGKNFPAQFIAEGIDQTRGWFYTLMVLSTALFDKPAFKNIIVNGVVLAEDGQKMSKRLKNYPDPTGLVNKYGADAMRYYLVTSPIVKTGDLNFSEDGVVEVFRKVIMLLWNVYVFYSTYQDQLEDTKIESQNILDKWILAKLKLLTKEITENLDKYDLQKASRPVIEFINELSTWYLRRSRERFKYGSEEDKQSALQTTNYVLLTLSKLMAPFTPFIAESLFQKVKGEDNKESVHLEDWLKIEELNEEEKIIIEKMKAARVATRLGLSARDLAKINVKQVLSELLIDIQGFDFHEDDKIEQAIIKLIEEEVNVKSVIKLSDIQKDKIGRDRVGVVEMEGIKGDKYVKNEYYSVDRDGQDSVHLWIDLTPELKLEGSAREIIHTINSLRNNIYLSINDTAEIYYADNDELKEVFAKHGEDIMKDTLCNKHSVANMDEIENKKEVKIGEEKVFVGIK